MRATLAVLFFAACSNAFRFQSMKFGKSAIKSIAIFRMAEESTGIVPVDKVNVESAGSVTGGILGFVLGGPVLAALFAAVTNYVIKKGLSCYYLLFLYICHKYINFKSTFKLLIVYQILLFFLYFQIMN